MMPSVREETLCRLIHLREHRSLLFAIAYRMVGSAMEAEDIVQESVFALSRHAAGVDSHAQEFSDDLGFYSVGFQYSVS